MMNHSEFCQRLSLAKEESQVVEFAQEHILHGTPHVFSGREGEFFAFKKRICLQYSVPHTAVFVVGSAKLGFSPHKGTVFTLDSDIDLAIVSSEFFSSVAKVGSDLEYRIRSQTVTLHGSQWKGYHKYLRYMSIGWIRPDLLPHVDPCAGFKDDWFSFFQSISYGKSEVGNYKVTAGVFRSQNELERYACESVRKVRNAIWVGEVA